MKRVIVLGQPNVGKTLFVLNFAAYLGVELAVLNFTSCDRGSYSKTLPVSEAVRLLVSDTSHYTRDIQALTLAMSWGKGEKQFELIDTVGLTDGIDHDEEIRKAMALTLRTIRQADIIFHLLDCARIAEIGILRGIGEIDYQIAQFGQLKKGYVILANKIDLPNAEDGLVMINQEFPGCRIISISALKQKGFKEVKRFAKQLL
ncbi:MAG: GTPase [Candidatus Wallacebacter cryptica]|nr:GTP-binding protein HSR1 [Bacillota bacterium]